MNVRATAYTPPGADVVTNDGFLSRKLYFDMDEIESAKEAFEEALKWGEKDAEMWIRKCHEELKGACGG